MTSPTTANTALLGKIILGRFRVLRHLVDGGMGAIYLARNEGAAGFVRPVVVKVLLPGLVADERMVDMFNREARIMSNLRHPSIVNVLDFAREGDMHVMVLDYVHGFHLGRWARYIGKTRGPFPVEIAIHITLQVLRALHYAHTLRSPDGTALDIIHRDVTPSNILIDIDGHTKLADFGIARMNTDKTEAGKHAIKGKFPYLPPELLEGADPSAQSDVYAVGVTLHEILMGRNEFRGQSIPTIIARILNHEATRPSAVRDDCSEALSDVIARALAKDRKDRFASAAEFADALAAVRQLTEDEAARRVSEVAGADFRDPRMAEVLAVPQLNDLESSWNTPTPSGLMSNLVLDTGIASPGDGAAEVTATGVSFELFAEPPPSIHSEKTVALGPRILVAEQPAVAPVAARSRPPRRLPWTMIAMAVGLAAVGVVAVIALFKSDAGPVSSEPAYVVVDDRERPTSARDAAVAGGAAIDASVATAPPAADAAAADARTGRDDPPVRKPPRDAGAASGPADTARGLSRTFERQKSRIQACFDRHTVDASGSPELAVRFKVAADGSVADAELVPAALGSTGLGACILDVARSTAFGTLAAPITFRVPLRARVKP